MRRGVRGFRYSFRLQAHLGQRPGTGRDHHLSEGLLRSGLRPLTKN